MNLKNYQKLFRLIKFIEFGLLGFLAYYSTIEGQNADIRIFIAVYLLLFVIWILDFYYGDLHLNNVNVLVRHFFEQNYFQPDTDVRITIHKKINDKSYRQFINYYPTGHKRGRVLQLDKGLVWNAFKHAKSEFSENFASDREKIENLIQKYNYRKEEAEQRIKDGQNSYYCCPIVKGDKVWGVIYMNSKKILTFPKQDELHSSQFSKNVKALIKMLENELD